ncbi:MAG: hypothetical protein ACXVAX_09970 [Pseudobdellovibrio sp.]
MKNFVILIFVFVASSECFAFTHEAYGIGLAGFSENVFGETTGSASGASQLLGEFDFPFVFSWDHSIGKDWYFSPQLGYGMISRETSGSSGKASISFITARFGKNMSGKKSFDSDWYFGIGILDHHFDGEGGTVVMNNGTGTATFAMPGASSDAKVWTTSLGTSYTFGTSRLGFDIVFENILKSDKRAQNLMLSYVYLLK